MQRLITEWEKIVPDTFLIKNLDPEYMQKIYNLIKI